MDKSTEVDDILNQLRDGGRKKKRINSNRKGKRGERILCQKLTERFQKPFAKNPDNFGSGAWSTTHADLQEGLDLDHLCGDIITPKGFRFAIENKKGYDIEMINLFAGANRKRDEKQIDDFLEQCKRDADRVGKSTLLFYTKDYCPTLAFIPREESHWVPDKVVKLLYKGFLVLSLDDLLQIPDEFFFVES